MAKAKYQGAAQRKGFSPISMNNSAPQRILQEASRQADGMRKRANAILEDRNTQSKAMAENYRIQADAEDRNFRISMGNMETVANEAIGRINERAAAQASIYEGLASLSDTAKRAADMVKNYSDKKSEEEYQRIKYDPDALDSLKKRYDANMLETGSAQLEAQTTSVSSQLAGTSTSVETSRQIDAYRGFSSAEKRALVEYQTSQFPSEMEAELSGDREFFDPQTGQNFKGSAALQDERLFSIASNEIYSDWRQKTGFAGLSSEFMAPSYETIRKFMVKRQGEVAEQEDKARKSERIFTIKDSILKSTDPVTVETLVTSNKNGILQALDFDYGKTARYFLEAAYATDYKGEYLMSEPARQAVLNSPFGANGETLGSYTSLNNELRREARVARISTAREDRGIRTLEGEEFFNQEQENLAAVFEKANAAEDIQAINTFEAQFRENFGDDVQLPAGYLEMKKQVTNENKSAEEDLLLQAEMGMDISMEQAMSITDNATREAAIKLVQGRQNEEYGGSYEDLNKSLKGYAKQLTGSDLSSEGISPMGQLLLPELQADYKQYYDAELAKLSSGGKVELTAMDYALAKQNALQTLQQDVVKGLNAEEGAKYSRKKETDNNLYEFPNLNLQERAAAARARYGAAMKAYANRGDKTFDSRGVILSDNEINTTLETYGRTGVIDIPPVVMKLSEISGELPIDILNRQIKASGNEKFQEIKPPDYYNNLKGQNPEIISLFHNATSARQRARALSQMPENLAQRMQTSDFDYMTNTVAGVESASHGSYDAYNTGGSHGGTVAYGSGNSAKNKVFGKPISQLTVGEIRRLHNSGKLHAAGRYQFTPAPFQDVVRELGLPDTAVFDKKTQDAFFITRLRQRSRMGMSLEEGLKLEWVGLQKLSDTEYRRVVQAARNLLNPNQSTTRQRVYTTGNIGPTSTGQHLDVKQVGGGRFDLSELDKYIEVDDKDHGTVSLSSLRKLTNNVGDSFDEHVARGSHGIDVGTYEGTEVYLKGGAKHVSNYETEHGTLTTIQLPDGRQFTFLHGKG